MLSGIRHFEKWQRLLSDESKPKEGVCRAALLDFFKKSLFCRQYKLINKVFFNIDDNYIGQIAWLTIYRAAIDSGNSYLDFSRVFCFNVWTKIYCKFITLIQSLITQSHALNSNHWWVSWNLSVMRSQITSLSVMRHWLLSFSLHPFPTFTLLTTILYSPRQVSGTA